MERLETGLGTEGGTRTLTPFRTADFESAASAIPPLRLSRALRARRALARASAPDPACLTQGAPFGSRPNAPKVVAPARVLAVAWAR